MSIPLEAFILDHLRARLPGSADPVEVARAFQAATQPESPDPEAWHRHLSAVRRAAVRMAGERRLEILRKGKPVPPEAARGVIRLRLLPEPAPDETQAEGEA